jgi:hypothetical protein
MRHYEFPTKLIAYHYLKDCIKRILAEGVLPNKVMFTTLSEQYETEVMNVERCLRTLVDKMWHKMDLFNHRPTNREFILTCTEHIAAKINPPEPEYENAGGFRILDEMFEQEFWRLQMAEELKNIKPRKDKK